MARDLEARIERNVLAFSKNKNKQNDLRRRKSSSLRNGYFQKGTSGGEVQRNCAQHDKLNGLLSLGIDDYWRKESIKALKPYRPEYILDIATGTGDFAILAKKILQPRRIRH